MRYRGYKINSVKCKHFAYPIGQTPTTENIIEPMPFAYDPRNGEEAALDRMKAAIERVNNA
jgi:hypothetical protein